LKDRIESAIDRLPEKLQSVFVLYELQGLKYAQIAEVLEIPLNSVKVYLMRARIHLQKELSDYGPES
jgi:RNA polymerase sigma-70 factor (ECF subfamily)